MPFNFWKSRPKEQPVEDLVGYFEPSVELEGKIKVTAGMVRLNTHFKGEITSDGTVVVADQGEVEAIIRAKLVSVAGKVKGDIHASDRLEIKEHGVVLGEIYARVLVVGPGGYFEGQCHMPMGDCENQAEDDAAGKDETRRQS